MLKHIYFEKHLALTVGVKSPLTMKFHIHVSYELVFIVSRLFQHHIQMSSINLYQHPPIHMLFIYCNQETESLLQCIRTFAVFWYSFHDGPIVCARCANGETEP